MHYLINGGWYVLLLVGLSLDWLERILLRRFALTNDLEKISAIPFGDYVAIQNVKKSLPVGPFRNRIKLLDYCSLLTWISMLLLLSYPFLREHVFR